MAIFHKVTR